MSHGIMELDRGYVNAESTWHKLPQYVCFPDRPITIMEAMEIADYIVDKVPLFLEDGTKVEGANALVREGRVLVPNVGERFTVVGNKFMLGYINENLLGVYPELKIESVGTLFNGATFFLNVKVYERQVKGDKSPTTTNLMYANPLGRGSYVACAHNTRIVCNNTEQVARVQGLANQSIKKFKHTANVSKKINDHLVDMAVLKLELEKHYEILDYMASVRVNGDNIRSFLDKMFPMPEDDGRAKTLAESNRASYLEILHGKQTQTLDNPYTKYGLYQAFTDWVDHVGTSRNSDEAAVTWDGIMGTRADKKQNALGFALSA